MDKQSKFIPENAVAFKHAARDLQRAYPLSLQQSQELLARVYGYADLHELQQTIAKQLPPGPYPNDLDTMPRVLFRLNAAERFLTQVPPECRMPIGRLTFQDLCLLESPDIRREAMSFHNLVEAELDPASRPRATDLAPKDYVQFDACEDDVYVHFGIGKAKKEGYFPLNFTGKVNITASNYILEQLDGPRTEQDRYRLLKTLYGVWGNHPNNPLCLAQLLEFTCGEAGDELDGAVAQEMWPIAQRARELFEQIIPKDFKGQIEPNCVSFNYPNGVENHYYLSTLYWGAVCLFVLEQDKKALAWARRCLRLHPGDRFGARFLIDQMTNKGTSDR
ncbi:MAG: hypothetical protein V4713_04000 [Pseudomonadota bacterium]